ncbi:hypothetical protein QBC38DRAFT_503029 [Podospora fimiseda]|uniref:DUF6604 domain-containing protein n=1 Tax=Podospora fimiseda TaxID=252190 RepID=A0AAN7GP38_9PEZI|nr:hypothetical protein QBC38DRAFT_503029 [Podospora fimiseda]
MSSSQTINSIYAQYKRDTSLVESWLLRTSATLSLNCQRRQTQLELQRHKDTNNHYILKVYEFKIFAKYIARRAPAATHITGAENFICALERAIKGRKEFYQYQMDNNKSNEVNRRHLHFIGVLQDVYEILEPVLRRRRKRSVGSLSTGSSTVWSSSIGADEVCGHELMVSNYREEFPLLGEVVDESRVSGRVTWEGKKGVWNKFEVLDNDVDE